MAQKWRASWFQTEDERSKMTLRKPLMIVALGAAVTVPAALALSSDGIAQPGPGGAFGDRGPGAMFEAFDLNADGQVTREEVDQFRADRFAEIDTNGDGTVSQEEFVAHAQARAAERAAERFAALDADGDGVLGPDVLASMPRGDMFARMDQNGDGVITEDEVSSRRGGPRR